MRFRVLLIVLACFALGTPLALAGTTGSISGFVQDNNQSGLPGVTVNVQGALLPIGRSVATDSGGRFRFLSLLPGEYTVSAALEGMGSSQKLVVVAVDNDTQVALTLRPAVAEAVEVTGELPIVDLRTTEINFNYKEEKLDRLPLARSYAGLFQLIPGVPDNQSFGLSGGASRQDNTFLLDGVNITNPGFGYLSTETNELDITEFNVKRAAFTPEFGRSGGVVTNAVTRAGTNDLKGTVRVEWLPEQFISTSKNPNIRNNTDRLTPAFGVGFPILHDHLFGYASGRFFRSETTGRTNNLGPVPDSETEVNEYHGKLTAYPHSSHFLFASYRALPSETTLDGVGPNDTPATATDFEGENRVATAGWTWTATSNTFFDGKYLHLDEENESVARTDLGFRPTFDVNNLDRMGLFFDPVRRANVGGASLKLNRQNFARDEVKTSLTQYLDLGKTNHEVKLGFTYETTEEDLTRLSNGWGSISLVQAGTQYSANYYPEQPSQLSKSRTYGIYLQDTILIGRRVVINAGVLVNRDEFAQELQRKNTFLTFGFDEEIQPRIGVNYNTRAGAGDKVYANYGRYYNMDQKSSARSHAPQRLFTSQALFDLQGRLISDLPNPNTTGRVIDPNLEPTFTDEFVAGYATPFRLLGSPWGVDVFYMYRDTKDFIEDQPRTLPASSFWVSNLPQAKRRYQAVTIDVNRPMANGWSFNFNYTWSRLEGNFDLDYAASAVFNTSSIIQDGPGVNVEEEFREGPLSQDREHLFKLFATYQPPFLENLTFGGYVRVQSGTPWEARGRDWYNGFRRYLEPAGTHRNDTWTNVDLLTSYRFPIGPIGITLEGRILNILNDQPALSRDQRLFLDGRIRNTSPPFLTQGMTMPNPAFGQATSFAPARRFLATVLIDF